MTPGQQLLLHLIRETPRRPIALHGLLQGRQTASILFSGLEYQQLGAFRLWPTLSREDFLILIESLIQKGLLATDDRMVWRTAAGTAALAHDPFGYARVAYLVANRDPQQFNEQFMQAVQVLSEASFHHTRYRPISADMGVQQAVRQWYHGVVNQGATAVIQLSAAFTRLSPISQATLSERLIAHDYAGNPAWQGDPLGLTPKLAAAELQRDILTHEDVALWRPLADNQTHHIPALALQTATDFAAGHSAAAIATQRGRQLSTITEHLQVAAIFGFTFADDAFYSAADARALQAAWQSGVRDYKGLMAVNEAFTFMQVRQFQIRQLVEAQRFGQEH